MLSLSPRYDLFRFCLPKDFMPNEVSEKYQQYINKEPGVLTRAIDYLNESIKGITFPGISDVNITQPQHSTNSITRQNKTGKNLGRINIEPKQDNTYVGAANPLDKIERKITVTFRMNQGLMNYFMLYETLFHRICKPYLYAEGDEFSIDVLNGQGVVVSKILLHQVYMDGMQQLDFSFDKIDRQSDTFTVDFVFNNLDMEFMV